MAVPFRRPLVSPVLVGRTAQLIALDASLDAACAGHGTTALLTGEAGIGKSRLVAETRLRATLRGMHILEGHCFEPDRILPYAPVLDLLRALLTDQPPDALLPDMTAIAPDLIRLMPELAVRLPDIPPLPSLDPEQEQRRLVHALAQFIAQIAATRPVLVIIEDLHWSDERSLDLLLRLARGLEHHPIVLLLTVRSDEIGIELHHFLASLDRERLATELHLPPLTDNEVADMVSAIFDQPQPLRGDFRAALHTLTDGNPFFVEEVLKSLVLEGDIYHTGSAWERKPLDALRAPRSVQDAVQRRLAAVSPDARAMLTLAAVAGRRFDLDVLRAVSGCDEPHLIARIKELIAAQFVAEETDERFAFRHALTRQAVYTGLLVRERRRLHATLAATIEQMFADDLDTHVTALSDHYHHAGAWQQTAVYAKRAGERASALYAPGAAIEQFSRAIEAMNHLGLPPDPQLHRLRGLAYETQGDFERAQADHETGLSAARAAKYHRAEWQILLDLGALWAGRDYDRAGHYWRRALDLARALGDPITLAHSLTHLGNWHSNVEHPREALLHHQEALTLFEQQDDPHGRGEAIDLLGSATYLAGALPQSWEHYTRALDLCRTLNDRQRMVTCLVLLMGIQGIYQTEAVAVVTAADRSRISDGEEAVRLAREIGWRSGEAFALIHFGCCLGPRGDYARALDVMRAGRAIADEIAHRQWMTAARWSLGALSTDIFDLPAARQYLEDAFALAREIGSFYWLRITAGLLAMSCIVDRDLARARAVLDATLPADTPAETIGQRLMWCARAELALAERDSALALALADRLLAPAANITPSLDDHARIPRIAQLRGEALTALRRYGEAEAALKCALAGASAQENRSRQWRIHAALGRLCREQRRLSDAERSFAAARIIVNELAARLLDDAVRDAFVRGSLRLLPSPRSSTPRRAMQAVYGGLTEREREVAALIARGQSNRTIADTLFLGEGTVATHVRNILAKLDLRSRTQIAHWVHEHEQIGRT